MKLLIRSLILIALLSSSHAIAQGALGSYGQKPIQAARFGNWKAVRNGADKPIEIYDLATDVGEKNDLAEAKPELVTSAEKNFTESRDWHGYEGWDRSSSSISWRGVQKSKSSPILVLSLIIRSTNPS